MTRAYFHALRVGRRFRFPVDDSKRTARHWIKVSKSQAACAMRSGGPVLTMLPLITVSPRQQVAPVRSVR